MSIIDSKISLAVERGNNVAFLVSCIALAICVFTFVTSSRNDWSLLLSEGYNDPKLARTVLCGSYEIQQPLVLGKQEKRWEGGKYDLKQKVWKRINMQLMQSD